MDYSTIAKLALSLLDWLRFRPRPKPSTQLPAPRPILIVEDDPEDAFLAMRVIKDGGYPCDWTESGEHALMLMSKTVYRMCIIDIGLRHGMSGWELAKSIRRDNPHMPLWLFTGTQDNLFCVEPGVPVGLLLKSMRWEALLDAIRMTAA